MGKPAVILDRDGTLIDFVRDEESGAILSAFHPSHVRLLPGVVEGLRMLQDAGYLLAVATNQPGPAKGQCSADAVSRTNQAVIRALAANGVEIPVIAWCPHHPEGGPGGDPRFVLECTCRKPQTGIVETLVKTYDVDLPRSWMVGDTYVDVETGRAAGLRTGLLMQLGRCEFCPRPYRPPADVEGPTLVDIARQILERQKGEHDHD